MEVLSQILEILNAILSGWLMLMLVYQLVITFFGYKRNTKDYQDHAPLMRFLVLVPAHNEEAVIGNIVQNLNEMDYPREMYDFYILADNCTDRTVEIARGLGANVLESHKDSPDAPTGKPIVLQKALNTLEGYQNKYDLVMFFDADNLIDKNMFAEVNSQYLDANGQADIIQCYLGCKNKKGIVAMFYYMTYTITNRFFQYAKSRLGLNSVIGGTGFAVSAEYLHRRGGWTAMSLTEDFELQIESTCEGKRILWNHNVRIYDEKPTAFRASFRQRTRWAQGHWFVAFKNTGKLFRALFQKKIRFSEFFSTFLYMYSLTPYVILMFQLAVGALMQIFVWLGWLPATPKTASPDSWLTMNWPSIVLFFYSFVFLFYWADWVDNRCHIEWKKFVPMLVSVFLNTVLAGWAQVVGLFKHRKQNQWVKTEHKIHDKDDMTVNFDVTAPEPGVEGTAEEETVSCEENAAAR